jgi:NADPH-dependent 2,4-dienoyl-CoA reductase/sulfur reductase-like enzyme
MHSDSQGILGILQLYIHVKCPDTQVISGYQAERDDILGVASALEWLGRRNVLWVHNITSIRLNPQHTELFLTYHYLHSILESVISKALVPT